MSPNLNDTVFVAPNAIITGDVEIDADSSIWYSAVIRGDEDVVRIGKRTSVQDGCVIHVDRGSPTTIGDGVTLGHQALIHGACVEDDCIIGMGSTLLNGARIGRGSIVGANALVTSGKVIPPHSLVLGSPGKVVRTDVSMLEDIRKNAEIYVKLSRQYMNGEFPAFDPHSSR